MDTLESLDSSNCQLPCLRTTQYASSAFLLTAAKKIFSITGSGSSSGTAALSELRNRFIVSLENLVHPLYRALLALVSCARLLPFITAFP
jgi:hypothetical protein